MTTKRQTKSPKKRGPKEERLVISEEPSEALKKLFRPKPGKDGEPPPKPATK